MNPFWDSFFEIFAQHPKNKHYFRAHFSIEHFFLKSSLLLILAPRSVRIVSEKHAFAEIGICCSNFVHFGARRTTRSIGSVALKPLWTSLKPFWTKSKRRNAEPLHGQIMANGTHFKNGKRIRKRVNNRERVPQRVLSYVSCITCIMYIYHMYYMYHTKHQANCIQPGSSSRNCSAQLQCRRST